MFLKTVPTMPQNLKPGQLFHIDLGGTPDRTKVFMCLWNALQKNKRLQILGTGERRIGWITFWTDDARRVSHRHGEFAFKSCHVHVIDMT